MPKNSYIGLFLSSGAFALGFGAVWHILWLSIVGLLIILGSVIARTLTEDTEYTIPKEKLILDDIQFYGEGK
jgi:cytochrome o ubiquinol oxidase subunit 1